MLKKARRGYSAKIIIDADYADDLELLINTPVQAEYLLNNLNHAAGSIAFHMNANKAEHMCFK